MRRVPVCKGEKGSIFIEFALAFAIIFTVFTGIFQFGYTFYVYNTLVTAVRDGARYAANKPYDSTTLTPSSSFQTAVQNMVVYGNPTPAGGSKPVVVGLTTANVNVTPSGGLRGTLTAPTSITVSISNLTIDAVFAQYTLNNRPSATFPYTGILTPP